MFDSLSGGGLNSDIKVRTWSTHTVELGDVFARVNKMLWCACRFFIGATVYGVLECPTFAVCLWVVHLEPHLLDNTGPLTRDTAVRRGVSLSEVYPLLCQIGMRHRGLVVYCIVQRGDVRSLRDHRDIREKLTCILRHRSRFIFVRLLFFLLFLYKREKSEDRGKSVVEKGPRFL